MRELTETEEAICAASIENSILMRRIIRLMPRGEPTPDYLEMLYSYAKRRNRTADLVNVLIGKNCPDVPRAGRDWYDWFQEVTLPPTAPDLFFLAWKYGWVLAKLESGVFAEEEDAESVLVSSRCSRTRQGRESSGLTMSSRRLRKSARFRSRSRDNLPRQNGQVSRKIIFTSGGELQPLSPCALKSFLL